MYVFTAVVAPIVLACVFFKDLLGFGPKERFIVSPPPTFKTAGRPDLLLKDVPELVKEMRESYNSGRSKPIEYRIAQLRALKKLLVDNEAALKQALEQDLGRPGFEILYYDQLLPIHEVDTLIKNLRKWLKPEYAGFNLLTFPSSNEIHREPLGLVLVIGTWNYPIMLSIVPLAGAIAAGNTCILKPCNVSKHTAQLMAKLIPMYLDPGICSVIGPAIEGDRHTTGALLDHKFDHVFFTGSPSVGRTVMEKAARFLTPCTLELGGKNPVFVDADADIELAAQRSVWGRMMNAGQQCIAPDYVLCNAKVLDAFLAACERHTLAMYGSDAATKKKMVGRIVGARQMTRLMDVLANHRGRVVVGGEFDEKERYIAPTVLHVPIESPAMEEETFGPMLLVVSVPDMDYGINYVNSRPKPLSMYVFSNSRQTQDRITQNTSAGGVTVNATLFHVGHPGLPFGGVGESGIGSYHGKQTLDTFVHKKPVLRKAIWADMGLLSNPFFLYPPWTDFKIKILRLLMKFV